VGPKVSKAVFNLKCISRLHQTHPLYAQVGSHPRNAHKAVLGGTHPQGVEGAGMAGPGETLGSLWIPLAMGVWEVVAMDSLEYHPGHA
jgi:hypothetical protein